LIPTLFSKRDSIMTTRAEVENDIQKELATARAAHERGNDGMMRVCARRAAGIAIAYWLRRHPRPHRGLDAMSLLRTVASDDSMPEPIRQAATRLTTRITEKFTLPFSQDPIEDATIIINYFLENT
jgi:HEPN domain-containing protein